MRKLHCTLCDKYKTIKSYSHDNPVLACGHTKTELDKDDDSDEVYKVIRDELYKIMKSYRVTYLQAKEIFWSD